MVAECGTRVLKTVLEEIRRLRSDPTYFENGTPMGSEVLEWLQVENLRTYAPLFIHHDLNSLAYVARLRREGILQLFDEHQELYPRNGKKDSLGGELQKLEMAHSKLLHKTPARYLGLVSPKLDPRTLPLSERLDIYRDEQVLLTMIFDHQIQSSREGGLPHGASMAFISHELFLKSFCRSHPPPRIRQLILCYDQ